MKKSKLGAILDTTFLSIIFFILIYFWILKLSKNAIFSIFCSIFVSILMFFIIFKYSVKKYKLENIKIKDQKKAETTFKKLLFMPKEKFEKFIEELLSAKKLQDKIYINKNNMFYVCIQNTLDEKNFFEAYNFFCSENFTTLNFICFNSSDEFEKLKNTCPVDFNVFSSTDLFLFMKEKSMFPMQDIPEIKFTQKLKNKFSSTIQRTHFKNLFFSGLSLIVLSVIIPYSIYYLIVGSILLILSIISLFFKNNQIQVEAKQNLNDIIK